jgi:hypothetical protein
VNKQNRRKWRTRLWIAAGIPVVLVAGGFLGWRMLVAYFQRQYYRETCAPTELAAGDIGDYPATHRLDDVPWFATEGTYCQSNSLQMIAAQRGIEEPRAYFDFLMGFTYGAAEVPGEPGFLPFTDPESGFVFAAPYLGLVRRYIITDDETLYLDALRHTLSQGYPVRVALDVAVLHDLERPLPHSEVLVGYDETGFYYYETVCMPGFPCQPGHLPPGAEGLWVSDQELLQAVLGQARMFSYPWRYSLSIFVKGPVEDDLGPVWARNGRSLIGGARYGPRQGADAIEKVADTIEERGTQVDLSEMHWGLEAAVYTRRSNATYLQLSFTSQPDLGRAADLFEQAADAYAQALAASEDGIADQAEANQVAALLRDAATAEREAGKILLARGQ